MVDAKKFEDHERGHYSKLERTGDRWLHTGREQRMRLSFSHLLYMWDVGQNGTKDYPLGH